ncbi:MAG: carboxypeptidase regulatory-like domain-containing protein [Planctomycetes bacterium]|nr:carboxypeptidase regulatory-like domain-containing protein [Planctomycetota bacterium]
MRYAVTTVVVLLAITCVDCHPNGSIGSATTRQALTSTVCEAVAVEYYAAAEDFLRRESVTMDRSGKAMWSPESVTNPEVATGRVEDCWGRPVAGVKVVIDTEETEIRMGEGTTDAAGRFRIRLNSTKYRGLGVEVLAEGYDRYAISGVYGGIVDYPVQLNRAVGKASLERLVGEPDAEQRLRMLLELKDVPLEMLFPYLGLLREDYRALIVSGRFNRLDSQLSSPASRAAGTLAYWCEPEDIELAKAHGLLLDKFAVRSRSFTELSGDSVDEILEKHRNEAQDSKAPWPAYSETVCSKDGSRALVEASMMYAHWGYTYYLVMARKDGRWQIVGQLDHMHMDFE